MSRALHDILTAADAADKDARAANTLATKNIVGRPQQRSEENGAAHPVGEDLNKLMLGLVDVPLGEIDRVILVLQSMRETLRSEGERVNRELNGYARLNHASLTAVTAISKSLNQWKAVPVYKGARSAN